MTLFSAGVTSPSGAQPGVFTPLKAEDITYLKSIGVVPKETVTNDRRARRLMVNTTPSSLGAPVQTAKQYVKFIV